MARSATSFDHVLSACGRIGHIWLANPCQVIALARLRTASAQAFFCLLEERGGPHWVADQAGATMADVLHFIQRVTPLMGELGNASDEQSLGVAQVGKAVQPAIATTNSPGAASCAGLPVLPQRLFHQLTPADASTQRLGCSIGNVNVQRLVPDAGRGYVIGCLAIARDGGGMSRDR